MWDEIWRLISSGSISGIPTIAVMALTLIMGVVVGYIIKRMLKIAIILGILVVAAAYLGVFSLSFESLKTAAEQHGPQVVHYATLIIGIMPLGIGFVIGVVIGFIFS